MTVTEGAHDRPRPRPTPRAEPQDDPRSGFALAGPTAPAGPADPSGPPSSGRGRTQTARTSRTARIRRRGRGAQVARVDEQGPQMAAAAGNAVVTAARVGRLLGRTGWRLARQLPGIDAVESQAQKLRGAAAAELLRMLELPQNLFGVATDEEQRALLLAHDGAGDPEPLRSAMTELLDRSTDPDRTRSRDYLFGTIVSQLVPDEARILATLAAQGPFAAVDVVTKQLGRSATRTVLANASTVGAAAAIASPGDTATHVTRLQGLGLVEIGTESESPDLASQYDALERDEAVQRAKADADGGRQASAKLVRRTVQLSALGREFWAACAPNRSSFDRQQG